jgi:hypothetical protein
VRRLLLVGAIGLAAVACGEPAADREPGPDFLEEHRPELVEQVTFDGTAFDPAEVALEAGQGIELENAGGEDVRITGSLDGDPIYDTGNMQPDEMTVIVFDDPGMHVLLAEGVDGAELRVEVAPAPEDEDA